MSTTELLNYTMLVSMLVFGIALSIPLFVLVVEALYRKARSTLLSKRNEEKF